VRALLAIGCNEYDDASKLNGAEADATRIFEALVRPGSGWYDNARSRLLLSPTLDDVRKALRVMLFNSPAIETFTFYFAGHGGVNAGSFYMWLRDTMTTGQSASALALADLFRNLNEASPRQTYIIIDACESGGLIEDLGVLLKPGLLGDAGTPALTLVATSARNQEAGESPAGGFGTNAILDCIEGREFVNDAFNTLDLVDIGRKVSVCLQPMGQDPVVWGLNLYGPPSFCVNPRYDRDGMAPLRDMVQTWPAEADAVIKENHDRLWATYTAITANWDQERYQAIVQSIIRSSRLAPEQAAGTCERLAATFLQRSKLSDDPFRGVLIVATLASSLLPFINSQEVEASAKRLLGATSDALQEAIATLIADLSADRFALLAGKGRGFPDLYFLPLRVAKVLGWAAVAPILCHGQPDRERAELKFKTLLKLILEHYAGSVVALSDSQAPAWCLALAQAVAMGLNEEGEQLAGLVFHSLVSCSGRLARWDLAPENAFEYLLARSKNDYSECHRLVERPIETLTVLFRAARLFQLEPVFNEALWRLDGTSFSAYIPSGLLQFSSDTMQGGQNLVWSIGQDVFRVEEFTATWPSNIPGPPTPLVKALAAISALLLPDRQPWFMLEDALSPLRVALSGEDGF
jgi:Caspase domain